MRPTLQVVSGALDVSQTYIEQARKLPPEQLGQLRRGEITLAELKSAPPKEPITLVDVVTWWQGASDEERATVVSRVGVVSPWHAIEANLE